MCGHSSLKKHLIIPDYIPHLPLRCASAVCNWQWSPVRPTPVVGAGHGGGGAGAGPQHPGHHPAHHHHRRGGRGQGGAQGGVQRGEDHHPKAVSEARLGGLENRGMNESWNEWGWNTVLGVKSPFIQSCESHVWVHSSYLW